MNSTVLLGLLFVFTPIFMLTSLLFTRENVLFVPASNITDPKHRKLSFTGVLHVTEVTVFYCGFFIFMQIKKILCVRRVGPSNSPQVHYLQPFNQTRPNLENFPTIQKSSTSPGYTCHWFYGSDAQGFYPCLRFLIFCLPRPSILRVRPQKMHVARQPWCQLPIHYIALIIFHS